MTELFWIAWEQKEKELKKIEPKCTCNGGRKHPHKTYHYASCPFLQFWDKHFREFWDSAKSKKLTQTILRDYMEKVKP